MKTKCPQCGKKIEAGEKFCKQCGSVAPQPQETASEPAPGLAPSTSRRGGWQSRLLFFVATITTVLLIQNFVLLNGLRDFNMRLERLLHLPPVPGHPGMGKGMGAEMGAGMGMANGGPGAANASPPPRGMMPPASGGDDHEQMASIMAQALTDPCGKCDLPELRRACEGGQGSAVMQKMVAARFADGDSKKDVFDFFVEHCGMDILSPAARGIYHPN